MTIAILKIITVLISLCVLSMLALLLWMIVEAIKNRNL